MYGRSFGQILRFGINITWCVLSLAVPRLLGPPTGWIGGCLSFPTYRASPSGSFRSCLCHLLIFGTRVMLFILKCASNVVSASGESEWPSPSLSLPWEDLPIWWSMACLKSHSTNGSELSSFSSEAVPLSPSAVFQPLVRLRKGRPMFQRRGPYKWRNWCRILPRLRLVIADCRWCSCI